MHVKLIFPHMKRLTTKFHPSFILCVGRVPPLFPKILENSDSDSVYTPNKEVEAPMSLALEPCKQRQDPKGLTSSP